MSNYKTHYKKVFRQHPQNSTEIPVLEERINVQRCSSWFSVL